MDLSFCETPLQNLFSIETRLHIKLFVQCIISCVGYSTPRNIHLITSRVTAYFLPNSAMEAPEILAALAQAAKDGVALGVLLRFSILISRICVTLI